VGVILLGFRMPKWNSYLRGERVMKRTKLWGILLTMMFLAVVATPMGLAQGGMGQRRQVPKYNPSTEVTVKGTVGEVKEVTGRRGWAGTHLTLKTENETLDVHLGPASFLAEKKFKLAKGDQIEVTGSKIKYEGADALLAREVKKGNQTLTLRNAQGIPQWSRSSRRH
jgi:DNA/RNA endonuclease YhcR with UshA esterase domain